MKTVVFLFSLLVLAHLTLGFLKEEVEYDFIDSSPSKPLRFSYATPNAARDDMTIDISITGDFGYEFDPSLPPPTGNNDRDRNMQIQLISPSGIVLDLGTYFNNNQIDNAPVPYQKFYPYFNAAVYVAGSGYAFRQYPNYGDRGYYNVQHHIVLQIPYDIINPITKEGGFTIEFTFSADVNPFFEPYPAFNYFGLNELFMTVFYFEGGIIGDPHFFGWDGQLFDFQGESNKIYNAITHKNLQLNLKLKEKEFASVASVEDLAVLAHNTFIGSIGLQTPTYDIAIHSGGSSTEDEAGYVLINHKMYQIRESGTILDKEGIKIEWGSFGKSTLHKSGVVAGVLYISTTDFEFKVFIIEQGRNMLAPETWNSHPFRFLELSASNKTPVGERIHGILGQTAPKTHAVVSEIAGKHENIFKLEGSNPDYEVSHLFGNDFKFNLFHRA